MATTTAIEWVRGADGSKGMSWNALRAEREIERNGERITVSANHCEHVNEACRFCYAERQNARLGGLPYKPGHRKEYRFVCDEAKLLAPLRRRKPTRIFVESMSDAFGDWWPREFVDKLYAVMWLTPQHTYINLSKRPERRRIYIDAPDVAKRIWNAGVKIDCRVHLPESHPGYGCLLNGNRQPWPLPNVIEGTSVSCQSEADEFRPAMEAIAALGCPTVVSYEPALGPIDWSGWEFLKWMISGGESGRKARPSHPQWHRDTRDWCGRHGVAYFFKQWGEWGPTTSGVWPPDSDPMERWGKKLAGCRLDGREHNGFPEVRG
jgi:protein gp37